MAKEFIVSAFTESIHHASVDKEGYLSDSLDVTEEVVRAVFEWMKFQTEANKDFEVKYADKGDYTMKMVKNTKTPEKVRERKCVTYKYESVEEQNKHKEEMLKQGYSILSDDWGSKDDTVYYCTEYIEGELPEID